MRLFLTLVLLFFLGGTLGWLLELLYRRFFSQKKWMNPGFLVGPFLPLYGFGLWVLYGLASADFSSVPPFPRVLIRVLLIGAAMTAIEYAAGKIFIVGMHVKLWDYSRKPGNVEGIICPEFSLYWTLLGALYCYAIHPVFHHIVTWFFDNIILSFFLGIFFGLLLVDLCYSFNLLAKVRKFANDNHLTVRLQALQKNIAELYDRRKFKHFVFSLRENLLAPEILRESVAQLKQRLPHRKKDGSGKAEKYGTYGKS